MALVLAVGAFALCCLFIGDLSWELGRSPINFCILNTKVTDSPTSCIFENYSSKLFDNFS